MNWNNFQYLVFAAALPRKEESACLHQGLILLYHCWEQEPYLSDYEMWV